MKLKYWIIGLALVFMIFTSLSIYSYLSNNKISEGVFVLGESLGGKTINESEQLIKEIIDKINKDNILIFTFDKHTYKIKYYDTGVLINPSATVKKAYNITRDKNVLLNAVQKFKLKVKPLNIEPEFLINQEIFDDMVMKFQEIVFSPTEKARFVEDGGKLKIIPSQDGKEVDTDKLKGFIKNSYYSPQNNTISIPVKTIKPDFSTLDAQKLKIHSLLSSYKTTFNANNQARVQNIKLASEKLNGIILKPEEELSFNEAVGNRDYDSGYEKAPVFIKDRIELDVGGGVCQVSTTLYNAALLADMHIVERSGHSMPVGYVPPGRDATVVYDSIDLKFKNTTDGNVLILTNVSKSDLSIKFYSSNPLDKEISIESKLLKKHPPGIKIENDASLKPGEIRIEEGVPGYEAEVWKIIKTENQSPKRILVSKNNYNSRDTVIYTSAQ
jgi:vancomycin resistance protein YoaR